MNPAEHTATPLATADAGALATLRGLRHVEGTGAPSSLWVLTLASLLAMTLALLSSATPALATGDANNETCPPTTETSPGFRASLPDCRAYEQATPVFKDGTELLVPGISEDGSSMIAQSLGGFAGTESGSDSTNGPTYRLSRSPFGWRATAIMPPSPLFSTSYWLAASSDLTRTLWIARAPSESIAAESLYVREANGVMVKIGPVLPPEATIGPASGEYQRIANFAETEFSGASRDLSHVLFEIKNGGGLGIAWPGDTTIAGTSRASLYEYAGVAQSRPELVGISDGRTVVPGENKGGALPAGRLISSCSTYLGSLESQDVYNAISEDGGTVFFTAEAGPCESGEGPEAAELYARIDGQQTTPISEPTIGSNLACEACKESDRKEAEFAGASRDGSKVFFLTEQELLSGAEGMNLYEYDFDNAPASSGAPDGKIVRVSGGSATPEVQGVARVSEDGSHVYFVAKGMLSSEPREGVTGGCISSLSSAERTEEEAAEAEELKLAEEHKEEPPVKHKKCRPEHYAENLYVFERDAAHPTGRLAFVATLAAGDSEDWRAKDSRPVQATPSGQFLVFNSKADVTAGDAATAQQVFEYDAASEELVRVSRGANDDQPQGTVSADGHDSGIRGQPYLNKDESQEPATGLYVSEDGGSVLFEGKGALTFGVSPAAPAGQESAYEYQSAVGSGGRLSEGDVYLIVPESPTVGEVVKGLDESGQDMFLQTGASLVAQDTDTQLDVYDARFDGGFPAPDPPAGCESCASVFAEPAPVTPASTNITAAGNLTATPTSAAPAVLRHRGGETPAEQRLKKLLKALKACQKKPRHQRVSCRRGARERYGPPKAAKTNRSDHR